MHQTAFINLPSSMYNQSVRSNSRSFLYQLNLLKVKSSIEVKSEDYCNKNLLECNKVNGNILHYRLASSYYRGCGTYNRTFCVTLWTLLYKVKFNTNQIDLAEKGSVRYYHSRRIYSAINHANHRLRSLSILKLTQLS